MKQRVLIAGVMFQMCTLVLLRFMPWSVRQWGQSQA
jgi:hypothetical protein